MPECGRNGNEWDAGDFEVVWEDVGPLEDPQDAYQHEDAQNTYCGTCGLALEIVVTWGDEVLPRPLGEE